MSNSKNMQKKPVSKGRSTSSASVTSHSRSTELNREGRRRSHVPRKATTRKDEKLYAAVWLDDYDGDYGVYCCFRNRDACLDYLADYVFERATDLEVDVVDIGGKPEFADGRYAYPKMTRADVRKQIDENGDFALVLKVDNYGNAEEQVTMGLREVEVRA